MFLVWAWADSRKMETSVSRTWTLGRPGDPSMSCFEGVWLQSGKVGIAWSKVRITNAEFELVYDPIGPSRARSEEGGGWFAAWETSSVTLDEEGRRLADIGETAGRNATVALRMVRVPMWAVVVLYLMGCGGLLVWQRRRWRRLLLEGRAGVSE